MIQGARRPETVNADMVEGNTSRASGAGDAEDASSTWSEESTIDTTLIAAEWDKAKENLNTLFYLILGTVGRAPVGLIRKFKLQALTGGDGQWA